MCDSIDSRQEEKEQIEAEQNDRKYVYAMSFCEMNRLHGLIRENKQYEVF